MQIDIRRPSVTGRTDAEKIDQLTRYLYLLTDQLTFFLNSIGDQSEEMQEQIKRLTETINNIKET